MLVLSAVVTFSIPSNSAETLTHLIEIEQKSIASSIAQIN